MAKKKTKSKARRRRKNPDLSQIDGRAALALALVGIGIGGTSAAIAGKHNLPGRTTIGAAIGGVLGMIMGAFLPKGRASNPDPLTELEGAKPLSMNPAKNPVGALTALVAGTVLAVVPAAIAIDIAAQRIAPPTVTGTYGVRKLHVVRKGANWAWLSEDLGGAALTRRAALESALGELAPIAGPNDHVQLHFERPTITVEVAPLLGGPGWSWALSTGEKGTGPTRGQALIAALDMIDSFGDPL